MFGETRFPLETYLLLWHKTTLFSTQMRKKRDKSHARSLQSPSAGVPMGIITPQPIRPRAGQQKKV